MLKDLLSSTKRIVIKIIPHHSTAIYKLEFSHRFAAALGVCSAIFVLALVTFQVGSVRAAGAQVHRLMQTDAAQRVQLQSFSRQTKALMQRLGVLQRNEREISRLTGLSTSAKKAAAAYKSARVSRAPARAGHDSVSLWQRVRSWVASHADPGSMTFAAEAAELTTLDAQTDAAISESGKLRDKAQALAAAREAVQLARERFLAAIPSMWPTDGYVSSGFGYRSYPDIEFHPGLDIVNEYGAPVYATAAGVVEDAGWDYGYGYKIVIDHGNGYETWYAHNSRMLVSAGDTVRKGQQIAEVGSTGFATGPHCHYEILLWGKPIDPTPYLDGVPAQLAKT